MKREKGRYVFSLSLVQGNRDFSRDRLSQESDMYMVARYRIKRQPVTLLALLTTLSFLFLLIFFYLLLQRTLGGFFFLYMCPSFSFAVSLLRTFQMFCFLSSSFLAQGLLFRARQTPSSSSPPSLAPPVCPPSSFTRVRAVFIKKVRQLINGRWRKAISLSSQLYFPFFLLLSSVYTHPEFIHDVLLPKSPRVPFYELPLAYKTSFLCVPLSSSFSLNL